jgi:hypothetical protein
VRIPRRSLRSSNEKLKSSSSRSGNGPARPRPSDRGFIDRKAGVGIDDLVAWVAHREDRQEQQELGALATSTRPGGTSISLLRANSAGIRSPREIRRDRRSACTRPRLGGSPRCRRPRRVPASGSRARQSPGARPSGGAVPIPVPEPGPQTPTRSQGARRRAPGAARLPQRYVTVSRRPLSVERRIASHTSAAR